MTINNWKPNQPRSASSQVTPLHSTGKEPDVESADQNLPLSFISMLFDKLVPPEVFQEQFLKALVKIQNVERGSIWIKKGNRYICLEAHGVEAEKIRGYVIDAGNRSIVGSVITSGRMTIAEPGKDERHFAGIEEALEVKNTLILCYPLVLKDGSVYGAVQILDTSAGGRRLNLDPGYLKLLESVITIGGIALSASLDLADQHDQNVKMRKILDEIRSSPPIIGQSETFLKVWKTAEVYAANDFPVLITGESGTGKELLAREIHNLSSRRDKPFQTQNCSAIPDTLLESELFGYKKGAFTGADRDKLGLFEAADGGSLFLDEVADMPLSLQAKILRVLQSSEIRPLGSTETKFVDVRIIAATNQDLDEGIAAGDFREDLFYRLNVLPLAIPPLRERREDIPLLLNHFLRRYGQVSSNRPLSMTPEAVELLVAYPWPGNIREMENLAKYLLTVTSGDRIGLPDLPPSYLLSDVEDREEGFLGTGSSVKDPVDKSPPPLAEYYWEDLERSYLLSLLESTRWNIAAAARQAGVKRTTFNSRMRRLGISKS